MSGAGYVWHREVHNYIFVIVMGAWVLVREEPDLTALGCKLGIRIFFNFLGECILPPRTVSQSRKGFVKGGLVSLCHEVGLSPLVQPSCSPHHETISNYAVGCNTNMSIQDRKYCWENLSNWNLGSRKQKSPPRGHVTCLGLFGIVGSIQVRERSFYHNCQVVLCRQESCSRLWAHFLAHSGTSNITFLTQLWLAWKKTTAWNTRVALLAE